MLIFSSKIDFTGQKMGKKLAPPALARHERHLNGAVP
jgi:hypothetical protein